jgi:hypothetical protein
MKRMTTAAFGIIMILTSCSIALAFDLDTLDRVAVQMSKSEVLALLGNPDEVDDLGGGLQVDVYRVDNMDPMVGTGCIYGDDRRLAGQSFIFQGEMGKQTAKRLQEDGFQLTEEKGDTFRLFGNDDDTGKPIVVHILQRSGMTVVMTFEKGFYDRRVNAK